MQNSKQTQLTLSLHYIPFSIMSILQALPESLSRCIIEDWLLPTDVGHLDSSIGNAQGRVWWRRLLQQCSRQVLDRLRFEGVDCIACEPLLEWILKRNIVVTHIVLPRHAGRFGSRCDPLVWPSVQSIDFSQCSTGPYTIMHSIANHCRNLLWVNLTGCECDSESFLRLLAKCRTLQTIKMTDKRVSDMELTALSTLRELRHVELLLPHGPPRAFNLDDFFTVYPPDPVASNPRVSHWAFNEMLKNNQQMLLAMLRAVHCRQSRATARTFCSFT